MSSTEEVRPDDGRLVAAMREFQAAVDAGRTPDRAAFLARHADVADELADCLDGLLALTDLVPGRPDDAVGPGMPLGDFRLVREVGRGGMGVVYEAEQLSLSRRVALKILPFAATLDARQLQRFRNEATAAAHLRHPNIVAVHGVGCERGVHYYAMQFIEGQTVADVVRRLREEEHAEPTPSLPPSPGFAGEGGKTRRAADVTLVARTTHPSSSPREHFRTVARWGIEAAEALEHAHALGVVHRDVKPANLLIDERGTLYVTDFGLARVGGADALTRTGDVVGTLRYMSPEQARGERGIDPRSDVYSLGATLYELLTLRPAFPAADRQVLLHQVLHDNPAPARRVRREVPAALALIVQTALAKDPAGRYPTARALAEDLRAWQEDRPIRARPPSAGQRAAAWARRHRPAVAAALACLALAAVGLAICTVVVLAEQRHTRAALTSATAAKDALARALDQEVQAAYGYRVPLAQRAWQDGDGRRAAQLLADCPPERRGWEWHYLARRLDAARFTLRPPLAANGGGLSTRVAFSGDGRTILVVAARSNAGPPFVQRWDAATGQLGASFVVPAGAGHDLVLSADGRRAAVYDHATRPKEPDAPAVLVFDVATGAERGQLAGSAAGVNAVTFRPGSAEVAFAGGDGTVVVGDPTAGAPRLTFREHAEPAVDVAFLPDGRTVLSLASRAAHAGLTGREPPGSVGDLCAWDADTGKVRWRVAVPLHRPFAGRQAWLNVSPDGRHVVVTIGHTVPPRVLRAADGTDVTPADGAVVRAFLPDGRAVVARADDTGGVIDLAGSAEAVVQFPLREPAGTFGPNERINLPRRAVAVGGDGRRVAFGHRDGRISVWDVATGAEVVTARSPGQPMALALSPDGRQVVAVAPDQGIKVWDVASAADGHTLPAPQDGWRYTAPAVSADGRRLAALLVPDSFRTASAGGLAEPAALVVWDPDDGRELLRRLVPAFGRAGAAWSARLRFSPDGRRLAGVGVFADDAAGGWPRPTRAAMVWDAQTGAELLARRGLTPPGDAPAPSFRDELDVRFGPNGRVIATLIAPPSTEPPTFAVRVWDLEGQEPLWAHAGGAEVRAAAVSPCGRWCALAGAAPRPALRVWDIAADRVAWELPAMTGLSHLTATFSPDGRRLLTQPPPMLAAGDLWRTRAVVWDSATGQPVCDFAPPAGNAAFGTRTVSRFAFSADGSRLAAFGGLPGIKVWDADAGRELLTLGRTDAVVSEATFGGDGRLVTRGPDGALTAWDGRPAAPPGPTVTAAALNAEARTLANHADPQRRDPDRAIELARTTTRAYPYRPAFWATLGVAQFRAGDTAGAVTALEHALGLGAGVNEGAVCFTLALVHTQLGRPEAARPWLERGDRWLRQTGDAGATPELLNEARRLRAEAAAALGVDL